MPLPDFRYLYQILLLATDKTDGNPIRTQNLP